MKFLIITLTTLLFLVVAQKNPHFFPKRNVIVHLFEWKWKDIGEECEKFLQHNGYGGVQISPPNENVIANNRPWWERYQPVSYRIETRSGDETAFKDMVKRCNAVGVRIYADAVINHMAGMDGIGTAGNKADYTNKLYPGVPFGPGDFHNTCEINNYQDASNVRNCQLGSLRDLNQGLEYVRGKIVDYLNHLVSLGVAGIRIDAAKHMWPADLENIYNRLDDLSQNSGFPKGSRPFIYQEVIDLGGESSKNQDYISLGVVTEFRYAKSITNVFQGNDKLTYLNTWGSGWSFMPNGNESLVFVDNHDTQRDPGKLTYKNPKQYKMAVAFMLAHPYGIAKIMSSYHFDKRDQGPPQDSKGSIISPQIEQDGTCSNGYVCEHRWRQIYNMVQFRGVVGEEKIENWWSNGDQQIAFCRGSKGFVAFTNWGDLNKTLQTCLPQGSYCDVISGDLIKGKCTGKTVEVNSDGFATIVLLAGEFDGVLALHVEAMVPRKHP